jgi:hypothetical protein
MQAHVVGSVQNKDTRTGPIAPMVVREVRCWLRGYESFVSGWKRIRNRDHHGLAADKNSEEGTV